MRRGNKEEEAEIKIGERDEHEEHCGRSNDNKEGEEQDCDDDTANLTVPKERGEEEEEKAQREN